MATPHNGNIANLHFKGVGFKDANPSDNAAISNKVDAFNRAENLTNEVSEELIASTVHNVFFPYTAEWSDQFIFLTETGPAALQYKLVSLSLAGGLYDSDTYYATREFYNADGEVVKRETASGGTVSQVGTNYRYTITVTTENFSPPGGTAITSDAYLNPYNPSSELDSALVNLNYISGWDWWINGRVTTFQPYDGFYDSNDSTKYSIRRKMKTRVVFPEMPKLDDWEIKFGFYYYYYYYYFPAYYYTPYDQIGYNNPSNGYGVPPFHTGLHHMTKTGLMVEGREFTNNQREEISLTGNIDATVNYRSFKRTTGITSEGEFGTESTQRTYTLSDQVGNTETYFDSFGVWGDGMTTQQKLDATPQTYTTNKLFVKYFFSFSGLYPQYEYQLFTSFKWFATDATPRRLSIKTKIDGTINSYQFTTALTNGDGLNSTGWITIGDELPFDSTYSGSDVNVVYKVEKQNADLSWSEVVDIGYDTETWQGYFYFHNNIQKDLDAGLTETEQGYVNDGDLVMQYKHRKSKLWGHKPWKVSLTGPDKDDNTLTRYKTCTATETNLGVTAKRVYDAASYAAGRENHYSEVTVGETNSTLTGNIGTGQIFKQDLFNPSYPNQSGLAENIFDFFIDSTVNGDSTATVANDTETLNFDNTLTDHNFNLTSFSTITEAAQSFQGFYEISPAYTSLYASEEYEIVPELDPELTYQFSHIQITKK